MSASLLKCPKCGHPRKGNVQCPSCGIVFAKYAEKQRRLEELELQRIEKQEEKRNQLFKKLVTATAVIGVVSVAFVMFSDNEASTPQQSAGSSRQLANPYGDYGTNKLLDDNIKKQVSSATFTVRNSRIRYPKDKSTSFLITRSCYALTDSYVSNMPDSSSSNSNSARISSLNSAIDGVMAEIEEQRQNYIATCKNCSQEAFEKTTKRLRDKIDSYQKDLSRVYQQMPADSGKADTLSARFNSDSYTLDIVERDEGLGVSLLHVNSNTPCAPVTIGDSHALNVGDEIFMLSGEGRVSNGVVTGFSTTGTGHSLILHSASATSIGGLLGTPLFNKQGEVLGINVSSVGNNRNALRIEEVLTEFGIVP